MSMQQHSLSWASETHLRSPTRINAITEAVVHDGAITNIFVQQLDQMLKSLPLLIQKLREANTLMSPTCTQWNRGLEISQHTS